MKTYLLLRDNCESGPYSFEEISLFGLRPLDLIWIEKESTCWQYPEEVEELKPFIQYTRQMPKAERPVKNEKIFVSLPSANAQGKPKEEQEPIQVPVQNWKQDHERVLLEEDFKPSRPKKVIWDKKLFQTTSHINVAAIFAGAVLAAILIKKVVDQSVSSSLLQETSVAVPVIDRATVKEANENYQNALVTEIVPVYKAPLKKSKPANIKKQLKLVTNNYKVGLFGGINGLQLTVFNTSTQVVDKLVVALDYLRPNGEVVQSENILFTSIKPKGSQTIAIPGSNRGVKVKYRIQKVYAHDYKADLKQI